MVPLFFIAFFAFLGQEKPFHHPKRLFHGGHSSWVKNDSKFIQGIFHWWMIKNKPKNINCCIFFSAKKVQGKMKFVFCEKSLNITFRLLFTISSNKIALVKYDFCSLEMLKEKKELDY